MIVPRIVLHTKSAGNIFSTATRKILICEERIFNEMIDIFRDFDDRLFDGIGQFVCLKRAGRNSLNQMALASLHLMSR